MGEIIDYLRRENRQRFFQREESLKDGIERSLLNQNPTATKDIIVKRIMQISEFSEIMSDYAERKLDNLELRIKHFQEYKNRGEEVLKYDKQAVKRDVKAAINGTLDVLKYLYDSTVNPKMRSIRKEHKQKVSKYAAERNLPPKFASLVSKISPLPASSSKTKTAAEYTIALTVNGVPERVMDIICYSTGTDKKRIIRIGQYFEPIMIPTAILQFYGLLEALAFSVEASTNIQIPEGIIMAGTAILGAERIQIGMKRIIEYARNEQYIPNWMSMLTFTSMKVCIPLFLYDFYLDKREASKSLNNKI